jgi:hypothetical protein
MEHCQTIRLAVVLRSKSLEQSCPQGIYSDCWWSNGILGLDDMDLRMTSALLFLISILGHDEAPQPCCIWWQ